MYCVQGLWYVFSFGFISWVQHWVQLCFIGIGRKGMKKKCVTFLFCQCKMLLCRLFWYVFFCSVLFHLSMLFLILRILRSGISILHTRFYYMLWCVFTVCIFRRFSNYTKTASHTNSKLLVFLKLKICAVVIFEHLRHHNVEFYCYCWKAVTFLCVSHSRSLLYLCQWREWNKTHFLYVSWKQRKKPHNSI